MSAAVPPPNFNLVPSNPHARSLLLWVEPATTGIAFGSVLVLLLAVKYVSCLSVLGNGALALLTATMAFRIYKSVLSAVNKTDDGHPFKALLSMDLSLREDAAYDMFASLLQRANATVATLRNVLLVVDFKESIKFAAAFYFMTCVGRWMNGITVLVWIWVGIFAVPKIYTDNQRSIDDALAPAMMKVNEMLAMMRGQQPAEAKKVQ